MRLKPPLLNTLILTMSDKTTKFNEMPNHFIEYIGKSNAKIKIRRVRPITKKPKFIPNKPKGFSDEN